MNKSNICCFSSNPFMYNLFIENLKSKVGNYIDKLHIYRDVTFFPDNDDDIDSFFKESSSWVNSSIKIINRNQESKESDCIIGFNKNYTIDSCKESTTDAFCFMHDDFFILDGEKFKNHIDYICDKKYDLIYVGCTAGSLEARNIINSFKQISDRFKIKDDKFMIHTQFHNGICTYWMIRKDILCNGNYTTEYRFLKKGTVINDILDKPYTIQTDDGVFEVFTTMIIKMYTNGFTNIYPFVTDDWVNLIQLDSFDFSKYKEAGAIHFLYSRLSNVYLNKSGKMGRDELKSIGYPEKLFTTMFTPILFFNFNKYNYMRKYCFDLYIPKLKHVVKHYNEVTGQNLSINKNFILEFGKSMELEIFPENLKSI